MVAALPVKQLRHKYHTTAAWKFAWMPSLCHDFINSEAQLFRVNKVVNTGLASMRLPEHHLRSLSNQSRKHDTNSIKTTTYKFPHSLFLPTYLSSGAAQNRSHLQRMDVIWHSLPKTQCLIEAHLSYQAPRPEPQQPPTPAVERRLPRSAASLTEPVTRLRG